jgi:hypothetical protein
MPAKAFPALLVITLVLLATPIVASAQAGAANGKYKFVMDDGLVKYLEFDVVSDSKGGTNGYMLLTDEAQVPLEEPNGDEGGRRGGESLAFSMKADIDGMTIEKNKAVITGMVRESSIPRYLGKWIRLVIEDNDGVEVQDKFGWSFCAQEQGGWIPEDAEVPGDRGAFMSWWATDAERKDDVGIPSPDIIPGNLKGCKSFPILAYDFAEFAKGDGIITIKQ